MDLQKVLSHSCHQTTPYDISYTETACPCHPWQPPPNEVLRSSSTRNCKEKHV